MSTLVFLQSQARSGTNWLGSLLSSHPDVEWRGEFLNPDYFNRGFYQYWRDKILEDNTNLFSWKAVALLREFLAQDELVNSKVVLYDLKIEQLSETPMLIEAIYLPGRKFIQLTRQNLLKQAVSEWIMFTQPADRPAHAENVPPQIKFSVDPGWIIARMRRKKEEAAFFNHRMATSVTAGIFRLSYEDLLVPELATDRINHLLDFLELARVPMQTSFVKQNVSPLAEVVENWPELRKMVENSEFSHTLYLPL